MCMIEGPRCRIVANTVDHIVPVALGGDFWAPENLRAACGARNSRGGSHAAAGVQRRLQAESNHLRRSRRHLPPFGDPPFRSSTGRPRYVQAGSNRPLTGDPDDRVISGRAKRSRLAGVPCYLLAIAVAALSFVTTAPALAASGSAPFAGSRTCEEDAERVSACELVSEYFRAINSERYTQACAMLGARLLFESGGPECPRFLAFAGRQHFAILTAHPPVAGRVDVIVALDLRE